MTDGWRANFCLRFGSNADFYGVHDTVGAHSARVMAIILEYEPQASGNLLRAALMHDWPEMWVGDIPFYGKQQFPNLAEASRKVEQEIASGMGWLVELTDREQAILHFADRMDHYRMMVQFRPHLGNQDGWPEAGVWLAETAGKLWGG